mgnify:CR=1 FL=1
MNDQVIKEYQECTARGRKIVMQMMDSLEYAFKNNIVIEKAKDYASAQKRSLSRIIESYLRSLIYKNDTSHSDDIEISPFVKSMATGVRIPGTLDYKKDYSDYLNQKYK